MEQILQKCTAFCKKTKPITDFAKCSTKKNGYRLHCKVCIAKKARIWRKNNPEKSKKHSRDNYERNYDKVRAQRKIYYDENRDELNAINRQYYKDNKQSILLQKQDYTKRKKEEDPNFRIATNIRSRMGSAIRGNYKAGSAVRDLGCSIDDLRKHLEAQFQEGMTWENYGIHGWHIDHIRPLKSFNLENRKEFLQACHYKNLQPLWWLDNIGEKQKRDRLEFQTFKRKQKKTG